MKNLKLFGFVIAIVFVAVVFALLNYVHENFPRLEIALFFLVALQLGALVAVVIVVFLDHRRDKEEKEKQLMKEAEYKKNNKEMLEKLKDK
ncbi:MAG TPA: hypothetical protein DIT25_03515 [Candidatus Moranbacteria bacterium]|nr:hypothetical protein [Candidatus Moranbacteria bacterium]